MEDMKRAKLGETDIYTYDVKRKKRDDWEYKVAFSVIAVLFVGALIYQWSKFIQFLDAYFFLV